MTTPFETGSSNTASGLYPGAYITEVTGGNACTPVQIFNVIHHESPLVDAGEDQNLCTTAMTAMGNANLPVPTSSLSYQWEPSGPNTVTYTPSSAPTISTSYTMTATNSSCSLSDEVILVKTNDDLYIKDTPNDGGGEPSTNGMWNLVEGLDVWVRNEPAVQLSTTLPRYSYEHLHEAVEWKSTWAGTPSTRPVIYVKVRNRGCNPITGTLQLYYHKLSANDKWDVYDSGNNTWGVWEEIKCGDSNGDGYIVTPEVACTNSITLAPGEEGVIEQVWNNVAQSIFVDPTGTGARDQWCLLARLNDGTPNTAETNNISAGYNAHNSNNIVQKNVDFINDDAGFWSHPFEFGSYSAVATIARLDAVDESTSFSDKSGAVFIDLGDSLHAAWVTGGKTGSGYQEGREKYRHTAGGTTHTHDPLLADPKPNQLKLAGASTTLENLGLGANDRYPIHVTFNYYTQGSTDQLYPYSFRQYDSVSGISEDYVGAVKYYIKKPACKEVSAGRDQTVFTNCTATLTASPSIPGAVYVWRHHSTGVTVDSGSTITIKPYVTTEYELEVRSPNGCVAYDNIVVTVTNDRPCNPTCESPNYTDDTLTVNTTITSQSVVIDGFLTVPNNVVLTVSSSQLNFTAGSGILVLQGGRLFIENSTLQACNDPWQGIIVEGNNTDDNQLYITTSKIIKATVPVDMDHVLEAMIKETVFAYGTTAINMNTCKDYNISKNQFYSFTTMINAFDNVMDAASYISGNYFSKGTNAIQLSDGDFRSLQISCNIFDSYTSHGVYSDSTSMSSQGSSGTGAGNLFVSSSSATNHQFRHLGNSITYYYDPSDTVTLTTGGGLTASSAMASNNKGCVEPGNFKQESISLDPSPAASTQEELMNIGCYPNPATERITYTYTLPAQAGVSEMIIRDVLGKTMATYRLLPGTNAIETDCSKFNNGVYFYSLMIDNKLISTERMVITR